MYNMIHANQQGIHWKQYSLFIVDQVDEHEKYKSYAFIWLCIAFPVRHQFINIFNKGGFTVSKNQWHIK